jgi:hypothetical protein
MILRFMKLELVMFKEQTQDLTKQTTPLKIAFQNLINTLVHKHLIIH